jgi:hypothetical protein
LIGLPEKLVAVPRAAALLRIGVPLSEAARGGAGEIQKKADCLDLLALSN